MRTFEAILILVNILSLFLSVKKQSKAIWAGITGLNVFIFLVHGIFEGLRYQMLFAYVFVFLLALFGMVKLIRKSETKKPKVLKWAAAGVSFVLLVFTTFLAYALPVFTLPEPTGSYNVGIQYFHLVDESRMDPFLDQSTQKRELMLKVYYPARGDDSKPPSPYFHDSSALIRLFTTFYNMPDFMFDHLRLVKTKSKDDLQLSDQKQNYPVVLFSHGAGTTMEVQMSQSEELASHGYIVVAIDHTYVSSATVFPDRIVSHKDATTDFKIVEPAEIITQIMADDATFVIEELGKMNDGRIDSVFEGRLDLDKIGALGHSVGGAVAYNLAVNDSRVKAAIDLDGVVYITPKGNPTGTAPFLMFASDTGHVQAIENRTPLMRRFEDMDEVDQKITIEIHGSEEAYTEAYDKAQQNVAGLTEVLGASGNLFSIEGCDHMKFTDIGLFIGFPPLREFIGIGGKTEPTKCLEITNSVTVAFFDQHLKGKTSDSLHALVEKYPELNKMDLE